MDNTSWVTAIVVAYNSERVLPDCLQSIARNHFNAIVVDNTSTDKSVETAEQHGAHVVSCAHNLGYGKGNNLGIADAQTPWVLIINPDVTLDPQCIAHLRTAIDLYPDAALLAPRLVEPDGRFFFQPRSLLAPYLKNPKGKRSLPSGDCCTPFLSGAVLLVRKSVFDDLGGFDPNIFLFYEDDDLCRRIADAGHSLVHVHDALARHLRGQSSRSQDVVTQSRFHQAWSRDYVLRKYGLPRDTHKRLAVNAIKWLLSVATLNTPRMARYYGSVAGAWAALIGKPARRG